MKKSKNKVRKDRGERSIPITKAAIGKGIGLTGALLSCASIKKAAEHLAVELIKPKQAWRPASTPSMGYWCDIRTVATLSTLNIGELYLSISSYLKMSFKLNIFMS